MRPILLAFAALALVTPACASNGGVSVDLDEFSIEVDPSEAAAGEVMFNVRNVGNVEHNFVVIETELGPEDLPVKGGEVQTDAEGLDVVHEVDGIDTGADVRAVLFDIGPGDHVLICNVPGHYQSGMHAPFRAT